MDGLCISHLCNEVELNCPFHFVLVLLTAPRCCACPNATEAAWAELVTGLHRAYKCDISNTVTGSACISTLFLHLLHLVATLGSQFATFQGGRSRPTSDSRFKNRLCCSAPTLCLPKQVAELGALPTGDISGLGEFRGEGHVNPVALGCAPLQRASPRAG